MTIVYEICCILVTLAVVVVLSALINYYYIFFKTRYYLSKFPALPMVPILGSMLENGSCIDLYENVMRYRKKYGRTYLSMVGCNPHLLTTDANLVEIVLSSSTHINKPELYNRITHFKNGLVNQNGDVWRSQRKMLTPTFHFKILEEFVHIFNRHTDELIRRLKVETVAESTDIHKYTTEWSIGQVTETIMGLKVDGSSDNTALYIDAGKELFEIGSERLIHPLKHIDCLYVFCQSYWKEFRLLKIVRHYIDTVIRRKEKEYDDDLLAKTKRTNEDGTKVKIASLDLLIDYKRNGAKLDIVDQVHTLLYAGFDTTSITVAFAIYNFAKHPEVQQKIFEEAYQVMGGDIDQEITTAHIQKMKYLDLALKESMRTITGIPLIARHLLEDLKYGEITLPKGLIVIMNICAMHIDPEYYPEPEEFIPERFLPENCKKRPTYAYIPFSAGPRNCIGQKFGLLAAKIGLVKLILNYKFVWTDHKLVLSAEISLVPKTGVKVAIRQRVLTDR